MGAGNSVLEGFLLRDSLKPFFFSFFFLSLHFGTPTEVKEGPADFSQKSMGVSKLSPIGSKKGGGRPPQSLLFYF